MLDQTPIKQNYEILSIDVDSYENLEIWKNYKGSPTIVVIEINSSFLPHEKNIKNEVTKYEISIKVIVEIKNEDFTQNGQIIIVKTGEYIVSDQYSQTINNEKKLIDILTNDLSDEIIFKLSERIDDL